eukprot:s5352_g4.t1
MLVGRLKRGRLRDGRVRCSTLAKQLRCLLPGDHFDESLGDGSVHQLLSHACQAYESSDGLASSLSSPALPHVSESLASCVGNRWPMTAARSSCTRLNPLAIALPDLPVPQVLREVGQ